MYEENEEAIQSLFGITKSLLKVAVNLEERVLNLERRMGGVMVSDEVTNTMRALIKLDLDEE